MCFLEVTCLLPVIRMKPKRRNTQFGSGCVFLSVWLAGLCINRWCLEELVKRDPHNFPILLQKVLRKTKEVKSRKNIIFQTVRRKVMNESVFQFRIFLSQVLEQCQYELVVPLTLLFSSTLLKVSDPFIISGGTHTDSSSFSFWFWLHNKIFL